MTFLTLVRISSTLLYSYTSIASLKSVTHGGKLDVCSLDVGYLTEQERRESIGPVPMVKTLSNDIFHNQIDLSFGP